MDFQGGWSSRVPPTYCLDPLKVRLVRDSPILPTLPWQKTRLRGPGLVRCSFNRDPQVGSMATWPGGATGVAVWVSGSLAPWDRRFWQHFTSVTL